MSIELLWPVAGRLSQRYGARPEYYQQFGLRCGHEGIDIASPAGTPVVACADGEVYFVEWPGRGAYGNQVRIKHRDGYKTVYAHLKDVNVVAGQLVKTGQRIGTVGSTGNSTGPHLHLTLKKNGATSGCEAGCCEINDIIDPTPYMVTEVTAMPKRLRPTIGRNILGMYVDHDTTLAKLRAERPSMVVVMDHLGLARRIRRELPDITVIHRSWRQDEASVWEYMEPLAFVNMYRPFAVDGIVLQVLNEPGWHDVPRLTAWLTATIRLFRGAGIRTAWPNFGVGNPEPEDVAAGKFDGMIRLACENANKDDGDIFAFHEYWQQHPVAEPWHIGRLKAFMERMDVLKLPQPQFALTEFGRDVAGGERHGYRVLGIGGKEYGRRNVQAMNSVYRPLGIPTAIFSEGEGGDGNGNGIPDWGEFNTEGDTELDAEIRAYNLEVKDVTQPNKPPPVTVPLPMPAGLSLKPGKLNGVPGPAVKYVNIRNRPDASGLDIGDLNVGQLCDFATPLQPAGWYYVRTALAEGWVSQQAGKVVIEPLAISTGTVTLTADELKALSDAHMVIAAILERAASRAQKG